MGHHVLRRHIWGYTVSLCHTKGTPVLDICVNFFLCVKFEMNFMVMRLVYLTYCRMSMATIRTAETFEPPRGKTNNVVSEQVRHKPVCTGTEEG